MSAVRFLHFYKLIKIVNHNGASGGYYDDDFDNSDNSDNSNDKDYSESYNNLKNIFYNNESAPKTKLMSLRKELRGGDDLDYESDSASDSDQDDNSSVNSNTNSNYG